MAVIISKSVKNKIKEYADSLTQYKLSSNRIKQKVSDMKSDLLKLSNMVNVKPSVCLSKDLGQVFDNNGNPTKEIYRHNYSDASNTQWAFAYRIYKKNVIVIKMMLASMVKESVKHKFMKYILSYNDYCQSAPYK